MVSKEVSPLIQVTVPGTSSLITFLSPQETFLLIKEIQKERFQLQPSALKEEESSIETYFQLVAAKWMSEQQSYG